MEPTRRTQTVSLTLAGALAAAMALPGAANAQARMDVQQERADVEYEHIVTRFNGEQLGIVIMAGAGVSGFVDSGTQDFTEAGASWDARILIGSRQPIGFEFAYDGSANDLAPSAELNSDAFLLGNGFDVSVRWNILETVELITDMQADYSFGRLQPYVYVGMGYRNYNIVNQEQNTQVFRTNDDLGEVPLGGGLAWLLGGFVVDLRAGARFAFENDLFITNGTVDANELHRWEFTGRLGYEF